MLKSYFLTAYRTLVRNKEYSLINIVGLSVSIASCLLLFFIVRYELSFDTFHTNRDRIFRITNEATSPEGMDFGMGVPRPLPEAMRNDFPQLEQVGTLLSMPGSQIDVLDDRGDQTHYQEELGVFYAEPQVFKMFSFHWLHGSPDDLNNPNVAVLTQPVAEKYFGNWKDAVGKTIEYRNRSLLKVVGILEPIPTNSDFPLKVVISWPTLGVETSGWRSVASRRQCYVMLDEHTTQEQIQSLMPGFEDKNQPQDGSVIDNYRLQPLEDIHFDERYGNYNGRVVSKSTLLALALIGVLLIITASINFVNLAIAQVMKRAKEVGVRKVMGSNRWQLSGQFFGETFIILSVAAGVAIVVTRTVLPYVRTLLDLPAGLHPTPALETSIFLGAIVLTITLFSGLYPARVLSGFKPVQALKSKMSQQAIGGVSLRKGLVVVQFAIAQVLVIVTLVVVQQVDFFRDAKLGFEKDSIIQFSVPVDSINQTRLEGFRNDLMQEPKIRSVSFGFNAPMSGGFRRIRIYFNNSTEEAPFETHVKFVDPEYFNTFELELVAGRIFQKSDTTREYVVNETFLHRLGITNPEDGLGKTITRNGIALPIVGVVKDFHQVSLQENIEPLIMMCYKPEYRFSAIKLQRAGLHGTIEKIGYKYKAFFSDNVFEFDFFDDNVALLYATEERLSSITQLFAAIAIFISALGLYGLISFMAVQRTKEVGIRKVLGASVKDILLLFCKEFVLFVLVAFVFAAPVTGYFMSDWLSGFAYRVELSPWIFLAAIGLSVFMAVSVISYRSLKAALANPVESLRSE